MRVRVRVIGLYMAIVVFVIPYSREWLLCVSCVGMILVAILWGYRGAMVKAYLMGGLIISVVVVTTVYMLWVLYDTVCGLTNSGYKQVFPQSSDGKKSD